jgi:hypothetical protein
VLDGGIRVLDAIKHLMGEQISDGRAQQTLLSAVSRFHPRSPARLQQ